MTAATSQTTTPNETAAALIAHCGRGGSFQHFWTDISKRSHWFAVGEMPDIPSEFLQANCYFSVHPATERGTEHSRVRKATVAAINCLFAEFDAKDWQGGKNAILAHLETFTDKCLPYPSVILDSGGGYHTYWFLKDPLPITDANREHVADVQSTWVEIVKGDNGAKDLARVLRVPGTVNRKPEYGPDFPTVAPITTAWARTYDFDLFESITGLDDVGRAAKVAQMTESPERNRASDANSIFAAFNHAHSIKAILEKHGYILSFERDGLTRMSRPGREARQPSVSIFTDSNPERSYHHSSSDPLHSPGYSHDAFDVYTQLEHNGDAKAAYVAAKRILGMGVEHGANGPRPQDDAPEPPEWMNAKPGDSKPSPGPSMDDEDDAPEASPLDVTPVGDLDLGWIDQYAQAMSEMTASPLEFNRLAGLVTIATAIQRRARVRMTFGDIWPNIYGTMLAPSSVYHKTSSLQKVRNLLYQATLDRLVLPEQSTSEGLIKELSAKGGGLILRDEIGQLFDSHHTKYLRGLKPDLTALYDGAPYSRRLSNEEIAVREPYLNILGATTPQRFFESITLTDWMDGFLPRWLFALPEGEPDFDAMTAMYDKTHAATMEKLAAKLTEIDRQRLSDFLFVDDAHGLWDTWQRSAAKDAITTATM